MREELTDLVEDANNSLDSMTLDLLQTPLESKDVDPSRSRRSIGQLYQPSRLLQPDRDLFSTAFGPGVL